MSQKTEDDTETQVDASDGSTTTFHESVKGYVNNSTGNGPTIGYSHITHIYNMSLGDVPAPEMCCNSTGSAMNHVGYSAPRLRRSPPQPDSPDLHIAEDFTLGLPDANLKMKPSITQLHMDFLTLSPEMQTYIKSQEERYWALAADSLENRRGLSAPVHNSLTGIVLSRRALNEQIREMSPNMQRYVKNLEIAYRQRKSLKDLGATSIRWICDVDTWRVPLME